MIAKLFTLRGACLILLIIVGCAVIIFHSALMLKTHNKEKIPDASTIEYISSELDRRNVDSCILEPIDGGWKCTTHDGKVYRVKAR